VVTPSVDVRLLAYRTVTLARKKKRAADAARRGCWLP
jgi:hypothetical protein